MHSLLAFFAKAALLPLLFLSSQAGYHVPTVVEFQNMSDQQHEGGPSYGTFNPTGGGTYRLYSSVGTSNSTITLTSFKEPVSNILYTMSYLNSTIAYGTLSPQSSISEFVSFTGITQNANGTASLTGVSRGLSRTPGGNSCTASTTLAQPHGGQSIFILSDAPCLFSEYYVLQNNATSTGILTFSSTTMPRYDADPGAAAFTAAPTTVLVDMAQLIRTALAGVTNATRFAQGAVQVAFRGQAASSTALGSTGAFAALTSDIATSSPSVATSSVVMSRADGKINPLFFASTTADNYFFLGSMTFATTTLTRALIGTSTPLQDAATINIDWGAANTFTFVLGASRIITFSDLSIGESIKVNVCQDSTGSRTLTWPSGIRWQFGAAPTLTTTAGKCDVLSFFIATSTTSIFGAMSANF